MTLILGIAVGAVIGWVAFRFFRLHPDQSLNSALLIGGVGGGLGVQLAPMLGTMPGADGQLNVFALVIAGAVASASLVVVSMIARRRGG